MGLSAWSVSCDFRCGLLVWVRFWVWLLSAYVGFVVVFLVLVILGGLYNMVLGFGVCCGWV